MTTGKERENYERGARLTFALIKEWTEKAPGRLEFAFPYREVALIADLRTVGHKLARNAAAHALVDHLIDCVVTATGEAPTAMMLRVILEQLDQPIEWVSLSELGLKVPTS